MENMPESKAVEIYETMCHALDGIKLDYVKEGKDADGDYTVRFSIDSNDGVRIEYVLFCDVGRRLLRLMSKLPVTFPDNKRVEGAVVVSKANNSTVDGYFDYDYASGAIIFKITATLNDCILSKEAVQCIVANAVNEVNKYCIDFIAVKNGAISVEKFCEKH